MPLLSVDNACLAFGHVDLLDHAEFQLDAGERVALIGRNGSGKSSLLKALAGQGALDDGTVWRQSGLVVAYVPQEAEFPRDRDVFTTIADGLGDVARLLVDYHAAMHAVAESADADALARLDALQHAVEAADAWRLNRRVEEVIERLALPGEALISSLSGGGIKRVALARALVAEPDLLLLDEPTNHLDLDAVLWLEQWLRDYRGTLLLISHDREFLDACVTHIAHIEQQRLTLYTGGYSDFERQRAERLSQQQSMFEKQQREIAHIEDYIRRFRAKATKARQAQSRIKALERMERIAAAHIDTAFSFTFREAPPAPDPLLQIEDGAVAYGDRTVLDRVRLTLRPGERVGLLGRNGAGKSTLIKLLSGGLPLAAGTRTEGKGLAIGYFAQHQLETLRPDESPLQHLTRLDPATREQELRDYLGGFDFRGDGVGSSSTPATTPCGPFSGGEKSRLALALMIWQRPNLLLLDEPTNHLDLEMRHALTLALQDFEGGMVLVSHDRALLRATCDRFVLVDDGRIQPFDGDLDDYRDWLAERRAQVAEAAKCPDRAADKAARKAEREQSAAERQARLAARRPLVKELDQIEKKMAGWQGEKKLLDARLADPALYTSGDTSQLQTLLKRQAELADWIDTAELRWLEISETLESLPAD